MWRVVLYLWAVCELDLELGAAAEMNQFLIRQILSYNLKKKIFFTKKVLFKHIKDSYYVHPSSPLNSWERVVGRKDNFFPHLIFTFRRGGEGGQ